MYIGLHVKNPSFLSAVKLEFFPYISEKHSIKFNTHADLPLTISSSDCEVPRGLITKI